MLELDTRHQKIKYKLIKTYRIPCGNRRGFITSHAHFGVAHYFFVGCGTTPTRSLRWSHFLWRATNSVLAYSYSFKRVRPCKWQQIGNVKKFTLTLLAGRLYYDVKLCTILLYPSFTLACREISRKWIPSLFPLISSDRLNGSWLFLTKLWQNQEIGLLCF